MSSQRNINLFLNVPYEHLEEFSQIPDYDLPHILLVQRYDREKREFINVGYMNKIFSCLQDADLFYHIHNPHMRSLNIFNTATSDWDPNTMLRYRAIPYRFEYLDITPWDNIPSIVGNRGKGWIPKPFSPLGSSVELGPVMRKGPGKPKAEYPSCPGSRCWCYDCAYDTTSSGNYDLGSKEHLLQALILAKQLRASYINNKL